MEGWGRCCRRRGTEKEIRGYNEEKMIERDRVGLKGMEEKAKE